MNNVIYSGNGGNFQKFNPFAGQGKSTSVPDWFSIQNYSITYLKFDGKIENHKRGENNLVSITRLTSEGFLKINGTSYKTKFSIVSNKIPTYCLKLDRDFISCSVNESKISIFVYRKSFKWEGALKNYTFNITKDILGNRILSITGGINSSDDVLEIDGIKIDKFIATFPSSHQLRADISAVNGTIEWWNKPSNAKSTNISNWFALQNFTWNRLSLTGKISHGAETTGSVVAYSKGKLSVYPFTYDIFIEIHPIFDRKTSDCSLFSNETIYCSTNSGRLHVYIPSHEDITLYNVELRNFTMYVDKNVGKVTITAGVNSSDDVFKISGMVLTKFNFK